jgi:hypothetical protein
MIYENICNLSPIGGKELQLIPAFGENVNPA